MKEKLFLLYCYYINFIFEQHMHIVFMHKNFNAQKNGLDTEFISALGLLHVLYVKSI